MRELHYLFVIKLRWRVEDYELDDLIAFDSMMEYERIATWDRAVPNAEFCEKLRSHDNKNPQHKE